MKINDRLLFYAFHTRPNTADKFFNSFGGRLKLAKVKGINGEFSSRSFQYAKF